MNQAALQGINGGLRAITGSHLVEHGADVDADSLLGDMQLFCDLAIAAALSDAGKNLRLPWG